MLPDQAAHPFRTIKLHDLTRFIDRPICTESVKTTTSDTIRTFSSIRYTIFADLQRKPWTRRRIQMPFSTFLQCNLPWPGENHQGLNGMFGNHAEVLVQACSHDPRERVDERELGVGSR